MLYVVLVVAALVFVGSLIVLVRGNAKPSPMAKPTPMAKPRIPEPTELAPDGDEELTLVQISVADLELAEDDDVEPIARAVPLVADSGAEEDEPTRTTAAFLVSAAGQSDVGKRRAKNEDRVLRLDRLGVYAVADGMGGYAGGEIASEVAVTTLASSFRTGRFSGALSGEVPRRAAELARAVQMANLAVYRRAQEEPHLSGMGTTMVAARFALRKDRLYLAHVGDSRCYRIRRGALRQLTADHTLGSLGMTGPRAGYLSRAIGVGTELTIDIVMGRPEPGDVYLLCSDGLTKMVPDEEILRVVSESDVIEEAASSLIALANEMGGRDNISVVLVSVRSSAATPR